MFSRLKHHKRNSFLTHETEDINESSGNVRAFLLHVYLNHFQKPEEAKTEK